MKFSPDVNHKPVVNWWKNFGHSTIDMSATPLFVSKLWERLAPVLFEIFQKKFFWWGSRPIWVTQWKEFQISVKKWRFEIFRTSALSRGNRVIHDLMMYLISVNRIGMLVMVIQVVEVYDYALKISQSFSYTVMEEEWFLLILKNRRERGLKSFL